MKIGLLSDTHSYLDPTIVEHFKDCDEIWHAGDIGDASLLTSLQQTKPTKAVFGNIDGGDVSLVYPENLIFECEGLKILITHIGGYPGKYPTRIKKLFKEHQPKLFICGHSHILKIMYDRENELLHINPGAAGVHGFHHVKTAVKFEIENGEIKNLAVIELGKRTSLI